MLAIEARKVTVSSSIAVVEKARPENACSNWAIYFAGRVASQAHDSIDLSRARMEELFSDPTARIYGRNSSEWLKMILDQDANRAVLNAWLPESNFDGPVGMIRPHVEDDGRWVSSVYVMDAARRRGVMRAMVESTGIWHEGEPFKLKVAGYNEGAQDAYRRVGFEDTGETTGYHLTDDIYISQMVMEHPGV